MTRLVRAIMGTAARRPLLVGALLVVLALAGVAGALTLRTSASTDSLVDKGTPTWQATQSDRQRFGDDAIYVLVQQSLPQLVLTSNLNKLIGLEGCLAGNIPASVTPPGGVDGPCARLAETGDVKYVFGPGTFINESVTQISDQLTSRLRVANAEAAKAGEAARRIAVAHGETKQKTTQLVDAAKSLATAKSLQSAIQLGYRFGVTSPPSINDPQFVSQIVFSDTGKVGTPKERFAYLFPSRNSALVQVRLQAGLSDVERDRALRLIRQAVAMPQWTLAHGGTYTVTGAPVMFADLTAAISSQLILLLLGAAFVMALALGVVFRARLRLLPLAVALGASAIVFGGLALAGRTLTMASIGVLPVLIGLGVDYAIQLQSRVLEERERRGGSFADAARAAASAGVPTIATAACATSAGFLAVALSPVPMVREFGLVLVAGVLVSMVCALALGTAVLVGVGDHPRSPRSPRAGGRDLPGVVARSRAAFGAAWTGAGELLVDNRLGRWVRTRSVSGARDALRGVVAHPGRVLAVSLVLAAAGWALESQAGVESNVEKLVPQNLPAMRGLLALEKQSGISGVVDVLVEGDNVASPAVVQWMTNYQSRLLAEYDYSDTRGCGTAQLCPAFSLPDLFSGGGTTQKQIDGLLDAVPPYFSQGVLTGDRHAAVLAFGLKLEGLDRQLSVIQTMQTQLDPPPGVTARVAGLPVLVAQANAEVASVGRRFLTLALSLVLVGLVLLAAFRSVRRALLPLIPVALASGWSALVVAATRVPLNPMSVMLGTLVIAIATEFAVLLSERYRRERTAGYAHVPALKRTYRSTGVAVLASGVTAIAGFAVLVLSDVRMLRDFGAVTVIDLAVALAGVLLVLPAVLTLAERRSAAGARTAAPRPTPAPSGPPARPAQAGAPVA